MSFLDELFVQAAGDEVAQQTNNEIKFENFVIQAKKNRVLVLKDETKECIITKPGRLFGTVRYNANDPSTKESVLIDSYLDLYDYLIKQNIITAKVGAASFWTWDHVNVVNPELIDVNKLQNLLKEGNPDYPNQLKCYTIQHARLSDMLKDYKYSAENQFETGYSTNNQNRNRNRSRVQNITKRNQNYQNIMRPRVQNITNNKRNQNKPDRAQMMPEKSGIQLVQIEPGKIGFPTKGGKRKSRKSRKSRKRSFH